MEQNRIIQFYHELPYGQSDWHYGTVISETKSFIIVKANHPILDKEKGTVDYHILKKHKKNIKEL
jgi:hypothetical protein